MISRINFRAYCSIALLACNAPQRPLAFFVSGFTTGTGTFPATTTTTRQQQSSQNQFLFHRRKFTFSASTPPLAMSATTSSEQVEIDVGGQLQEVRDKVVQACEQAGRDPSDVTLVAVSKTKPLELLKQAYEAGQRIFGENYAQELVEKAATMGEPDITWHFIGGLQSNKANMLVKGVVPYGKLVVETVSSIKVANKLNNAMSEFGKTDDGQQQKLDVFVQVNTSGEESKSGVTAEEALELCQHIRKECDNLHLKGLMTIGAPDDAGCLDALYDCRQQVASALGVDPKELGLSMGMSDDFDVAIQKGSTNVRVGSTIFGARDYSNKQ